MKTTVHIPDTVLDEARKIATVEKTTVKTLIEEGLRHVIFQRKRDADFRLRKATFKGNGLHPEAQGLSWEKIRDITYAGRGG